jgi:hypothetical protein
MTAPRKRVHRREGFLEGQDKVLKMNTIYRTSLFNTERARKLAQSAHESFDEVAPDEPQEELEDSDISDSERRQAMARERTRREGRT